MLLTKFSQVVVVVFAIAWTLPVAAQTYTVLYSFTGGADGALPIGGLTLDSQGNLYGTAACTLYSFRRAAGGHDHRIGVHDNSRRQVQVAI